MNRLSADRTLLVIASVVVSASFFFAANGCGHRGGVVEETDEYSYADVAAQIRAEDAASEAEHEERGR